MKRGSIVLPIVLLSVVLLALLVGSNLYLDRQIANDNATMLKQIEALSSMNTAQSASKAFGDLKYWLTDLAVSQLMLSERKAFSAQARLFELLDRLEIHNEHLIANIRRQINPLVDKALMGVEAYADDERVLGNSLMSASRTNIREAEKDISRLVESLQHEAVVKHEAVLRKSEESRDLSLFVIVLATLFGSTLTYVVIVSIRATLAERDKLASENERTKQELMEREVRKQEAEAANRLKSEFLATISHEVRTPMNAVIGMAGILLDSDLTSEQRQHALVLKDSGDALLMLLNDILDLSKIEAGQVELEILDFELMGLLESMKSLWESRLQSKGLQLTIGIAPDVPLVLKSDPTRIRQILFNLISNASKFTEHGGISIEISKRHADDDRLELRFAVTDTGMGITPEARSRLFNKFSQADGSTTRKFGGTGLGLAICKELTQLLGGEIDVESVPGRGATFWFTIWCALGDSNAIDTDVRMSDTAFTDISGTDRSLRILVAEDNHVNQVVLQALLSKTGHRIDMVANGSEAVSAVIRGPYDLVLMDIHMPEMDGVTASRRIRELSGEVGKLPIIALTANAMKGDREKYIAAGMTDYVSKPINPRKLIMAIARCTGQQPADFMYESEIQTTPVAMDAGDVVTDLTDLMSDLDALMEEEKFA